MVLLAGTLLPAFSYAETWQGLPPPPLAASASASKDKVWMLGLVVNGRESSDLAQVQFRDNHYLIRAADLARAGIPDSHLTSTIMDVSAMPEVKVEYQRQSQRIVLTVPLSWLPEQVFGTVAHNGKFYPGRSSNGVLFNYDLYTSDTSNNGSRMSAWNELRFFGPDGQLGTNGILQQQFSGSTEFANNGYIRYDTWWATQNEAHALNFRVGDLITDSLSWTNSVRLGGIQVARDFSVRPDLITYPLPSFTGQTALPATVDLFVNGYKNSSNSVQSGAYAITNLPFVNGAGEAVVVTTDSQGRRVTTTTPFYVASQLLKGGLSDFSFSAGALRNNYGLNNFDYGKAATSGSYRYGVADWLTLETHAEGAESLALGGGGALVRVGPLGVINGAVATSQMLGQSGNQYSWGYQYNSTWFNLGASHTQRTSGFGNLGLYGDRENGTATATTSTLSRRSTTYNASVALDQFGNVGAALIDITSGAGDRTRLLNLSWSRSLWRGSNLYISATRDQEEGNWSGAIAVTIPFTALTSGGVSFERDSQGNNIQHLYVSRSMPSDGGFAYNASFANSHSTRDYSQGTVEWRNNKLDVSAGYYGTSENNTTWGDMKGSLILMDSNVFAANQVNDAFVLVKTGYPDIKVSYENQLLGTTDRNGYLMVPRVSSYYPAKYNIDTLDLPANMGADSVEQRFSVRRQSGYLLNMPVTPIHAANVILHDQNGQPIPVSSSVSREDKSPEYVGWDGIVWMEKLSSVNNLHVETPDGRHCDTSLKVADTQPKSIETFGPLVCSLSPLPAGNTP